MPAPRCAVACRVRALRYVACPVATRHARLRRSFDAAMFYVMLLRDASDVPRCYGRHVDAARLMRSDAC